MLHLPIFAALFSMLNQFYQGHLNLAQFGEQAQSRFANARVLCVGAGGLACHLLPLLATAGIGRITLIDGDLIVTSNLQRQTLFTLADRGQYKARVAALRLRQLNPESEIDALCCPFSAANAEALFTQHDVILDCADNATTTYLINHTALIKKRPWVHGSVEQIAGQCALFTPDTPCYACLFSENEMPAAQSCSARGVFSPAVAMVASYQATLLLRYLAAEECLAEAGLFFFTHARATATDAFCFAQSEVQIVYRDTTTGG